MGIVFPDNRPKMHVVRLFGVSRDTGARLDSMWLDVLRRDEIVVHTQDAVHQRQFTNQFQKTTVRLDWQDQQGVDMPVDEATGATYTLKVFAPDEENPSDPREYVPVTVRRRVRLPEGNVVSSRRFLDAYAIKNRLEFMDCRFFHYDTTIDETARSSGLAAYYSPIAEYQMLDNRKDEDDYVEHEVAIRGKSLATPHWLESNGDDHDTTFSFRNEFLLDYTDPASGDVGPGGRNPPFRLDAFQNIINCRLAGLAVHFYDGAS